MTIPPLLRNALKRYAPYFVRMAYRGILARDPDEEGLATYAADLRATGDLAAVIRGIASSEEAWQRNVYQHPGKLVEVAFRGLLERDPEAEALHAYSQELSERRDLSALLSVIGRSQEHWEQLITERAEYLVETAFLGVLKRPPDAEALATYSVQLRLTRDLAALICSLANSEEHWESLLAAKRDTLPFLQSDNLPALLSEVVKSQQHWNELLGLRFQPGAFPSAPYSDEAWVFVHIQKTGGTSLQNMLVDTLGDRLVYREHADTLYLRSPAELAQYYAFAGHFNYDSVAYIPRLTKRLVTFLRDPQQRLISLYRFLRAHEASAPAFNCEMEIANSLDTAEFFRSVLVSFKSSFWNHVTWCVMGQRQWQAYRKALDGLSAAARPALLAEIRSEIRKRLNEFEFIGLQEDFSFSCQQLFQRIGAQMPTVRHDHSVELLAANLRHIKYVEHTPVTPQLESALAPLVQLDEIVYREACDLYCLRYGRAQEAGMFRSA